MRPLSKFNKAILLLFIFFLSCSQDEGVLVNSPVEQVEDYIPKMEIPEDNKPNKDRIKLGMMLYNETLLSLDSSISCASCHNVSTGLADNKSFSLGVGDSLGFRNSPTLFNIGYHPYFFADGGVPTLELQVLAPIEDQKEMHLSVVEGAERLSKLDHYNELAVKAYGRKIDPYVITRALAAFERTLISFDSRYDQFVQGDSSVLNEEEILGMNLFFSDEVDCKSCHSAPLFTNFKFENIGIETPKDLGRMRITADSNDRWKFKVPTLRNIELTAPYFHDGSAETLHDAISYFNSHPINGKDSLRLTKKEIQALESFLKTLTDIDSFRRKE